MRLSVAVCLFALLALPVLCLCADSQRPDLAQVLYLSFDDTVAATADAAQALGDGWQTGPAPIGKAQWQLQRPRSTVSAKQNGGKTVQSMRDERQQGKWRTRRIIFNNDGDDSWAPETKQEFLNLRTAPLVGSHVDTIFYGTAQSLGSHSHNSRAAELSAAPGTMAHRFIEQGTDNLEVMVDFCHTNGIEVFWSLRMNDTHDYSNENMRPRWKSEHPEYLIGTPDNPPRCYTWTSADFSHSWVRTKVFRIVRDVCERYDVDGIELDFFRHLCYFKTPSYGGVATEEEIAAMTDLVRRIRAMADEQGARRGRPILIAMRLPDSLDYCRALGLDLQSWLEDDLLDILVVGGYMQLNPWEYSVGLGKTYGVPVYPSLDESRHRDKEACKRRMTLETYRARAAEAWEAGMDGIYVFNVFDPRNPLWNELGDPEKLRGLSKTYFVNYRTTHHAKQYLATGEQYVTIPHLDPVYPMVLQPGQSAATTVTIGDDPSSMPQTATVVLRLEPAEAAVGIAVSANGHALEAGTHSGGWMEYAVPASALLRGANSIEVRLGADAPAQAGMTDLELCVEYEE